MQRVGNREEELGNVAWDDNSGTVVLWLKDTCGVLGADQGYLRGDEFVSMTDAKAQAASAPSAFIMHMLWMRKSVTDQVTKELEENWETISSELGGDVKRNVVRDKVADYLRALPSKKLKEWSEAIAKGVIIVTLAELIKNLLGL